MASLSQTQQWCAIVPFKGSVAAKSRLHALYGVDGEDWARAFLADILDVLNATPGIGKIVVVTGDSQASHRSGIDVIADNGGGLNEAILLGARGCSGPTIVIPADLATVNTVDLSTLLAEAALIPRGFVRDATGDGTALLFALSAHELKPDFGSNSAQSHLDGGAKELGAPLTLRLDIDDSISLVAASSGLGIHAKRLLALAKNFPSND
jgi:2-phospho-L-lactate guanylyltransferase